MIAPRDLAMVAGMGPIAENTAPGKATAPAEAKPELLEAAQQFESLLLHMMFKAMRATVPEGELFSSHATETFESMRDEEMARTMAEQGGLGLAKVIARQLDGSSEAGDALRDATEMGRRLQALTGPNLALPGTEEP